VLIGPEGGFADQELELLRAHGLALCSLGPYRLRTETAAVAAAAALLWAAAG
jgi:16S rRNA (uracil1498-N3)-methyltransferase